MWGNNIMKKILIILFIILFSNTNGYTASNNAKKIAEKLIEYNNEDFKNSMSQENIKIFMEYITSSDYVISPADYGKLDILRTKISNEDMKKISLKLEKDIEIYAKRQYDDIQQSLMYQIEESGIKHVSTLENIRKYYKVDIKYSTVLKYTKMYYYNILTQNYPELAQSILKYMKLKEIANDADYNENISSYEITQFSMYYSGMEVHHEDADVTYAYKLKTPLKLKGIFTLSNINNNVYISGSEYLNNYLPKTEFSSYDKSIEINGISIRPKKFTYGSNIYPNILSSGILGEVNFDTEITIKPSSKIILSRNPEENILIMYVDEVKLNKIISSVKYNRNEYGDDQNSEYKDKQHNIDTYKLTSSDGYVNVRNSPNGKVIKKINLNSSEDNIVYYYKGLYNFKELEGILYIEEIARKFKINAENYYNQIKKLLNMKNLKIGNWYKVVYFPKNTYKIDDAVVGYIHSSQMEKISNSNEYY